MSVKRAQAEIDSREFAEWIALEGFEPWSQYRDDIRIGFLGASLAGLIVGGRHKPQDFIPDFTGKEPSGGNLKEMHDIIAKRFGARARNPDGTQWKPDNA